MTAEGQPIATISEEYVGQNTELHAKNPNYGAGGDKWADRAWLMSMGLKATSVLDYGCGKGGLVRALIGKAPDRDYFEYDPAVKGKDVDPEPADMVVCTDVLEHVEPDKLRSVLEHIAGLCKVGALFVVDTRPAKKTFPNGQNAHLIVKPPQFWFDNIALYFDIARGEEVDNHGILFELKTRKQKVTLDPNCSTENALSVKTPVQAQVFMSGGMGGHVLCPAWANGVNLPLAPVLEAYQPDFEKIAVTWGLLRGTPYLYHRIREARGRFIYIDHGYFNRGHFKGHYRAVWDGFQQNQVLDVPDDRWKDLGLSLTPWRRNKDGIVLVCPPSPTVTEVFGLERWADKTVAKLRKLTKRPIVVREKIEATKTPLTAVLPEVSCIVTHNSMAAVEGIRHGVPAIVHPCSAAAPVAGTRLEQVNDLPTPDRQAWANSLAYSQWTIREIQSGLAHKTLLRQAGLS